MKYKEIQIYQIESLSLIPEGYLASYSFEIDIFNLDLYRKLAIDFNRHNLLKVIPIPVLKNLLGNFTYYDNCYKYGMSGKLALKAKDSDFFEKCKAFEAAILTGMDKLGYNHEIDFEINIISWNELDSANSLTNVCDYIAADTTYNTYHPKFKQIEEAEFNNCLFKYSNPFYYEDNPNDAKKIIKLLRANKLEQNYVNSDLLPILKYKYSNSKDLCCKIEKCGMNITIYNNADNDIITKVLSAFK